MFTRPRQALLALAIVTCIAATASMPAAAADKPPSPKSIPTVVFGGTCVATPHNLVLSFGSPLQTTALQAPAVQINGTLTCAGDPVIGSIDLSLGGYAVVYTCAAGDATLAGTAQPSAPVFADFVAVHVVQDGIHVHVTMTGQHVTGAGDFVWSTTSSISGCPGGQVTQSDLTGSFTYVYL